MAIDRHLLIADSLLSIRFPRHPWFPGFQKPNLGFRNPIWASSGHALWFSGQPLGNARAEYPRASVGFRKPELVSGNRVG